MVFLNRNKTSGIVKLLIGIWVTCLIIFFQMQRDKIHTKERRRRVERREKVGWRVVLEGRWDRWLYEYIMVRGLLLRGVCFFFLKVRSDEESGISAPEPTWAR